MSQLERFNDIDEPVWWHPIHHPMSQNILAELKVYHRFKKKENFFLEDNTF